MYTLQERKKKLEETDDLNDACESKTIKNKLEKKYRGHILFTAVAGRANLVVLRNIANYLINDKWYSNRKTEPENEAEKILRTASKLTLEDIRDTEFDVSNYLPNELNRSIEKGK